MASGESNGYVADYVTDDVTWSRKGKLVTPIRPELVETAEDNI